MSGSVAPVIRKDAPRPADMLHVLPLLEEASALFVLERYEEVIPRLTTILEKDPYNLDAALRLATAHSALNRTLRRSRPSAGQPRSRLGLLTSGCTWRCTTPRDGLATGGADAGVGESPQRRLS